MKHAINAGELLLQAKEQVEHGDWIRWLRDHCAVSDRSAQKYMALARHAAANPSFAADLGNLGVEAALQLLREGAATGDDIDADDGDDEDEHVEDLVEDTRLPWQRRMLGRADKAIQAAWFDPEGDYSGLQVTEEQVQKAGEVAEAWSRYRDHLNQILHQQREQQQPDQPYQLPDAA